MLTPKMIFTFSQIGFLTPKPKKLKKPKITDFGFRISDLGKGIVKF